MKIEHSNNSLSSLRKSAVSVAVAMLVMSNGVANAAGANKLVATGTGVTVVKQVSAASDKKVKSKIEQEEQIYIVRFKEPALAQYTGGIKGIAATSNAITGKTKLNTRSTASKQYKNFLKSQQKSHTKSFENALGRNIKVTHTYQNVFNGMAISLTNEEAKVLAKNSNVVSIERETHEIPLTDVGPAWMGAESLWEFFDFNSKEMGGTKGEGAVVAILDTGINHDHPSFADVGHDGYDHSNPLGEGNYIPGSYCDTVNPDFCNDKLIGAWDMVQSGEDPSSPEDNDGHGSHTAGTVAGNVIDPATLNAPTTSLSRKISGVAPHANIIAYDVCIDSCPGSALIAAVEQVVEDAAALPNGIQALNYSISGGNDPYNSSVELAFLNVTAAGIYVAASAGNAGPGASTTGHNSPWVSTTAAMTHPRGIINTLGDMESDGASLGNLVGAGFTTGYGPASIVYAGDFPTNNGSQNDTIPEQCLDPFPAGHFSGQIVVCDRGSIARTAKGQHVLAGGAGGYVLANAEANGESTSSDGHFLPGVHLGYTDGQTLKNWIASNTNTTATILGSEVTELDSNADITAGFSSRGPNLAIDILKPDIAAPGVDIMAAVNSGGNIDAPEFGLLSGTSMSSPHNAGAGALISMLTDWTPYEIKSVLMMTAKNTMLRKDDGVTATDHFDVGAGRIQLEKVLDAALVLSETPENFLAANPETGGDPKTLNIASMQNSECVGTCSWTRTVTNKSDRRGTWLLSGDSDTMSMKVEPRVLRVNAGESKTVTVTVDTTTAADGWNFGDLNMRVVGRSDSNLHMPVVAKRATSTSDILSKTVDKAHAVKGDTLNYEIKVANTNIDDVISIMDMLPEDISYVDNSLVTSIEGGTEVNPAEMDDNTLSWSVQLEKGSISLSPAAAPFGFLPLASIGVEPFECPASSCDEGAHILNVPAFDFNGETYTQVIWSINGTLEVGSASGSAAPYLNKALPDESTPNNLIAPFWTDLDLSNGGSWYVASGLSDGVRNFTVYEWSNAPLYGEPESAYSFQIWVQEGTANIWMVYDNLTELPAALTVGVENDSGTQGTSYYYNGEGTAPVQGASLGIDSSVGGTATLQFQAVLDKCKLSTGKKVVNKATMEYGNSSDKAIAVTTCDNK
ncbi:S8 family serine peptidase [Flocculibacter collagenilyticus]|uniref:S8 family serine peptidase n=1 Tax=Flocculibacter collagenilyticus TaxID=2744479 RepID=UPI0018F6C29E|nr:S8 family serine peptidase [Flocculibacter collagenilyticus]